MRRAYFVKLIVFVCALLLAVSGVFDKEKSVVKSQEVSDSDGIPGL